MRIIFGRILCAAVALGAAAASAAEFNDSFTDVGDGASIIGVHGNWKGSGTATGREAPYSVPGFGNRDHCVVFEGMITNSFSARVTPDSTSNVVFQLVSKLAWWSELPDASYTSSKQGGICVTNNGILLAYTSDGWTRLADTNTVGAITSISSNTWSKLDFVLNYWGGDAAELRNRVFYQVRVSNHVFRAVNTSQRYKHGSRFVQNSAGTFLLSPATFTAGTAGVGGIVIGGAGSIDDLAVVPGNTETPLSSAIDIRAYRSAEGVWVEFAAVDEEAGGGFVIVIRQNGVEIARRTVAQQGPNAYNVYRELFSELQVGQSYDFIVYDETGRPYYLDGVKVGEFAVSLVRMVASEMTIEWDSIAGRTYQVLQAEDGQLGGQFVPVPGMASVVATGAKSSAVIRLDPIKRSGFFRIIEK
jgi:hypothetical protein